MKPDRIRVSRRGHVLPLLLGIGLAIICRLSVRAASDHPPHDSLKLPQGYVPTFKREYEREFKVGGQSKKDTLKVMVKVTGEETGHLVYHYTLTRTDKSTPAFISLYNIAAQGRLFPVTIRKGSGQDLKIGRAPESDPANVDFQPIPANGTEIDYAAHNNASTNPAEREADPHKIWFVTFSDLTCSFEVLSKRKLHKPMVHPSLSHDTEPPPSDGGGPDGEP